MRARSRVALCVVLLIAGGLALWLLGRPAPDDAATSASGASPAHQRERDRVAPPMPEAAGVLVRVMRRADAAPAAGAEVTVGEFTAVADAEGRASVEGLPAASPIVVEISAAGAVPLQVPVQPLAAGEMRDLGTAWLESSVGVRVVVRSLVDDTSLPGARVQAFRVPAQGRVPGGMGRPVAPTREALTGHHGEVTFPALPLGNWTFRAAKDGFATRTALDLASGGATHALPARAEHVVFTIRLPPAVSLRGRVVDQFGEPHAGAVVVASPGIRVGARFESVRTAADEQGAYVFHDLHAGAWRLQVAPGGHSTHGLFPVSLPLAEPLDLVVPRGGALFGRVTDAATGAPLGGARVTASAGVGIESDPVLTDAEGRYEIGSLPPCTVRSIVVTKEGFAVGLPEFDDTTLPRTEERAHGPGPVRRRLDLPLRHGERWEVDVALQRAATLRGVVRSPDGVVPFATVRPIAQGLLGVLLPPVTADELGRFSVGGLRPGPLVLQASKAGWYQPGFPPGRGWLDALAGKQEWAAVTVDVPAGEDVVRDLHLRRGTPVSGVVRMANGEPVQGATVAWYQSSYAAENQRVGTDEDGRFELPPLAPDSAAVIWPEHPSLYAVETLHLPAPGETPRTDLELVMVERSYVVGEVRCAHGHDLRGATVSVWTDSGRTHIEGRSVHDAAPVVPLDADGTFCVSLAATPSGTFRVRVDAPGHRMPEFAPRPVEVSRMMRVEIVLEEFEAVRGVVLSSDGRPIAGARVGIGNYGHTTIAITDAEGLFEARDFGRRWGTSFENFWLWASAPGHESARVRVEPDTRGAVAFELSPLRSITGTVHGDDWAPLARAIVVARPAGGEQRAFGFARRFAGEDVTDDAGRFAIRDLPPGRYTLAVRMSAGSATQVVQTLQPTVDAGAGGVKIQVSLREDAGFEGPHAHLSTPELGQLARAAVISRKDDAAAVALWQEVLARPLNPTERAQANLDLADSLHRLGRAEERLRALEVAVEVSEAGSAVGARATTQLAGALSEAGRDAEALGLLGRLLREDGVPPTSRAYARYLRALSLRRAGRDGEALEAAEALAADLPEDPRFAGIRGALRGLLVKLRAPR